MTAIISNKMLLYISFSVAAFIIFTILNSRHVWVDGTLYSVFHELLIGPIFLSQFPLLVLCLVRAIKTKVPLTYMASAVLLFTSIYTVWSFIET